MRLCKKCWRVCRAKQIFTFKKKKMIKFELKNNAYMIGSSELTTDILLQYPHEIQGENGEILLPYSVGDRVIKYPSSLDRAALANGEEKVISEFTVFGGTLCCQFNRSNIPHAIDCVSPI